MTFLAGVAGNNNRDGFKGHSADCESHWHDAEPVDPPILRKSVIGRNFGATATPDWHSSSQAVENLIQIRTLAGQTALALALPEIPI